MGLNEVKPSLAEKGSRRRVSFALDPTLLHRHSGMRRKAQTSDAQLRIGESRDSRFVAGACHRAAHRADPVASPRNDGVT
jgi:hypothetical protein